MILELLMIWGLILAVVVMGIGVTFVVLWMFNRFDDHPIVIVLLPSLLLAIILYVATVVSVDDIIPTTPQIYPETIAGSS